jgi:Methyltransferase domain
MPTLRSNLGIAMGIARSFVPFRPTLRHIKRRIAPYRANRSNSHLALHSGLRQIALLRKAGANLTGGVLEVGTGWLPIIPMLFRIAGATRIVLADIERLMDAHTIGEAARLISDQAELIAEGLGLTVDEVRAKAVEPFQPAYNVPWKPSDIRPASVDIIVSRTVFEHIPPEALAYYLTAFHQLLRPGGMMCHFIDHSDHWQHHDAGLSRINMLRYEDSIWWRLMCRHEYMNRLRHSDYVALFEEHGWETVGVEAIIDEKAAADLRSLRLAARFRDRPAEDLATLRSVFLVRSRPRG